MYISIICDEMGHSAQKLSSILLHFFPLFFLTLLSLFFFFFIFLLIWTISSDAKGLLLWSALEIIRDTEDQILVGHMQGESPSCCVISLAPQSSSSGLIGQVQPCTPSCSHKHPQVLFTWAFSNLVLLCYGHLPSPGPAGSA